MQLNFLFDNLTIFSVLKIIFIHRSYRVLNLYATSTTELENDFSTKITELSHQYLVPVSVTTFDRISINRSKCEEPILNIVFMNNLSSTTDELEQLKKHLRPNEFNLILITAWNKTENQINFEQLMNFDKKLLIMSNSFIASVDRFNFNRIYSIPLQPFDKNATKKFLYDLFVDKVDMNGTKVNIFMQHLPPESMVSATDEGEIFNGPDGCLSELLMKSLKANPNFWSDIGVMYPSYREWKNDPLVAPRLHYRKYHKEILTSNFISSVNRT